MTRRSPRRANIRPVASERTRRPNYSRWRREIGTIPQPSRPLSNSGAKATQTHTDAGKGGGASQLIDSSRALPPKERPGRAIKPFQSGLRIWSTSRWRWRVPSMNRSRPSSSRLGDIVSYQCGQSSSFQFFIGPHTSRRFTICHLANCFMLLRPTWAPKTPGLIDSPHD